MGDLEIFLWGAAGGAIPDILRLVRGRHKGAPDYLRTFFFWIMLVILMIMGGLLAWRVAGATTWLVAMSIGFSGPEILTSMLSKSGADRGETRAANLVDRARYFWSY